MSFWRTKKDAQATSDSAKKAVASASYNSGTKVITFTRVDGTTFTLNIT